MITAEQRVRKLIEQSLERLVGTEDEKIVRAFLRLCDYDIDSWVVAEKVLDPKRYGKTN